MAVGKGSIQRAAKANSTVKIAGQKENEAKKNDIRKCDTKAKKKGENNRSTGNELPYYLL